MKHRSLKKSLSVFLSFLLLIGSLYAFWVPASAAAPSASSISKNDKTRHTLCTELSDQAELYYTGSNTYENLIQLAGATCTESADAIGSPLFNRLQTMMRLSNTISYSSLTDYYEKTDANASSAHSWLFYSDQVGPDASPSREHVWPKSHGNFVESGAGSDLHHLRPEDSTINSTRGNCTMGNVRNKTGYTISTASYKSKTVLWKINGYSVDGADGLVEVADNIKGDVARIYLYVFVTYGSSTANKNLFTSYGSYGSSSNDGKKVMESLATLLEWNAIDPVDEWEMKRNDLTQNVQGNRNVFIDYPELAWYLFNMEDEMPVMETPSGNASGSASNYTITAISNNTSWGTVALSGKTITASPKTGYYVAGYTVTNGTATVTQDGNTFRVVPSSDCTVRINFAAKQTVTLTYMVNGVVSGTGTGYTNEPITLPSTAAAPSGWTFLGWVPATVSETETRPQTIYTGTYTALTNTTLFALFSKTESGTGSGEWTKMTSAAELASGVEIVFAADTKNAVAGALNNTYLSSVACTAFSNNKITSLPADAMVFTVGGRSGAWTFTSSAGQLYTAEAKKVNFASTGTGTWTVTLSGGNATVESTDTGNGRLQYNANSPRFLNYTSNQTAIQIYYLDGTGGTTYYATNPTSAAHDHVMTHHPAAAADCTTPGNIEYWTCNLCAKAFADEDGDEEITPASTVIEALGHAPAAEFSTNGTYHWHVCTRCGESCGDEGAHDFSEWVVATEPTEMEAGDKTAECTICQYVKHESIPALGALFTVAFLVPDGVDAIQPMTGRAQEPITLPDADDFSANGVDYTFVGWVEAEVDHVTTEPEYLSGSYAPTSNVTLLALYTYSVGGAAGYQLVEEALTDWSGDYLIAYSDEIFADGRIGGSATNTGGIGTSGIKVDPGTALSADKKTVTAGWGDLYNVTLESVTGGYVMKTKDGKYNYHSSTTSNNVVATESLETASANPLTVTFASSTSIVIKSSVGAPFQYNTNGYFRFYNSAAQKPVYLYKRSAGTAYYTTFTSEEPVRVTGISLTLSGEIKVNAYVSIPDQIVNSADGVYYSIDSTDPVQFTLEDKTENGYQISVPMPAKDMYTYVDVMLMNADGDPIEFYIGEDLYDDGTFSFCVHDYIDRVLNAPAGTVSETLVALCKAMSDYGYYAQILKNYHTQAGQIAPTQYYSNDGTTYEAITADSLSAYVYEKPDPVGTGIAAASVSVEMLSDTSIHMYFRTPAFVSAADDEKYIATVTSGGIAYAAVTCARKYSEENEPTDVIEVVIRNILPNDFGKEFTVTLQDDAGNSATIENYSVLSYVRMALLYGDALDPNLVNLVKALYVYGEKATAFVQ